MRLQAVDKRLLMQTVVLRLFELHTPAPVCLPSNSDKRAGEEGGAGSRFSTALWRMIPAVASGRYKSTNGLGMEIS